jgi:hypothetical protein
MPVREREEVQKLLFNHPQGTQVMSKFGIKKYDIADEWCEGFCASIRPHGIGSDATEHYRAGWEAGYAFREKKNELLNQYMVSIGEEPFGVVRLA